MAVGDLDPVSASNLGAVLGAGSDPAGTGGKPVSVDGLAAALGIDVTHGPIGERPVSVGNLVLLRETDVSVRVTASGSATGGGDSAFDLVPSVPSNDSFRRDGNLVVCSRPGEYEISVTAKVSNAILSTGNRVSIESTAQVIVNFQATDVATAGPTTSSAERTGSVTLTRELAAGDQIQLMCETTSRDWTGAIGTNVMCDATLVISRSVI